MSNKCDICGATENLAPYTVKPKDNEITLCSKCLEQVNKTDDFDFNHLRCLNDSMWSENLAVQVVAWRLLKKISDQQWASDLFDMLYLDDEALEWAGFSEESSSDEAIIHVDSNGVKLEAGDTVTLTKDLNVKGASFIAKRGTAVRRISLDPYNAKHIEGRVNGQKIVILTEFTKKSK